tara:strand:+ start:344 stop:1405 length:1062 start_codon:yes stop_codon:yes gene_type:complete
MTLQSSGSISFTQIATEFGYPNDNKFGNYRIEQDVGELGELPLDVNIPQTGQIKFSDFYGASLNVVVDCYSGNDQNRINVKTNKWNNNKVVVIGPRTSKKQNGSRIIIHVNKKFGHNSENTGGATNNCALRTGDFDSASSVVVDVGSSGKIFGSGGKGGAGADHGKDSNTNNGAPGSPGTSALGVEFNGTKINVANGGIIRCGYGGGGGGGSGADEDPGADRTAGGGGGGGGAGLPAGSGGRGGTEGNDSGNADHGKGSAGAAGSLNSGGDAGGGGSSGGSEIIGGAGGQGGGYNPSQIPHAGGDSIGHDGSGGDGGAAGVNGAAIRRKSGHSIIVNDPGNGVTGSTNATGVS